MTLSADTAPVARQRTAWRRPWLVANLLMACFAVIWITVNNILVGTPPVDGQDPGLFPERFTAAMRLADQFSYFTVWSNVVVALAAALVLAAPATRNRTIRALHLTALVMITVTFLVYWTLLARTSPDVFTVTNLSLHFFSPIVTVVTWLVAGPAHWLSPRLLPWVAVIPSVWVVYTFIRGAILHVYPYGFINLVTTSVAEVAIFVAVTLAAALLIGFGYCMLDRRLPRRAG